MRVALPGASISVVSEPRAVATGSCAQLNINSYFVNYFLIRSHPPPQAGCPLGDPGPLAVLTRFVATITFNYTLWSMFLVLSLGNFDSHVVWKAIMTTLALLSWVALIAGSAMGQAPSGP